MKRIAFVAYLLLQAWPAAAQSGPPYEAARQAALACEGRAARSASAAMSELEQAIRRSAAPVWTDVRNKHALIVFLLCGGSAPIARAAIAQAFAEPRPALLDGALAFAERRTQDAYRILASIDFRSAPPEVGAPLALARGRLAEGDNPEFAERQYQIVRLLAPGAPVDALATRESVALTARHHAANLFAVRLRAYLRRVVDPRSADDAFADIFGAVDEAWRRADEPGRQAIGDALTSAPHFFAERMFIALSKSSMLAGAGVAAAEAARLASSTADETRRSIADLYGAIAAAIAGDRPALSRLEQTATGPLDPETRMLRASALALAQAIYAAPDTKAAPEPRDAAPPQSVAAANSAVAQAEEILARSRK